MVSVIICSMPGCDTSAGCQCGKPRPTGWPAGKQIIAGAKEALAVAKGEQPAASITVNGHTYYPSSAFDALRSQLEDARENALEEAARVAAPLTARPCDCERCDCGNAGDAKSVAAWDEATTLAAAIRKLKEKP